MSNARVFFAGVATTIFLIGAGFGGGLMMGKTAMEPTPPSRTIAADRLPSVRVILPASAEAAPSPTPAPAPEAVLAFSATDEHNTVPATDLSARADKEAERIEKKKAEAVEREHRKRAGERKTKREGARLRQRHDQRNQPERAPIMAFGGDEQPRTTSVFGN
jgi:hypothetical protein